MSFMSLVSAVGSGFFGAKVDAENRLHTSSTSELNRAILKFILTALAYILQRCLPHNLVAP